MLYTVRPLERIYARPASYTDIKQDKPKEAAAMEYHEVSLKHGMVVTRREGENYVVDQLYSTDMQDYLKADYTPGKNIKL